LNLNQTYNVPCLIRVPTEQVKQRTQALLSSNTYQVLLATLREEGVRGLYRGYGSAVHREVGTLHTSHLSPPQVFCLLLSHFQ
uniref:Mitochondrial S-adenosylmethionine carrier protein n=1 Tax=Oncorhynchus tshawytscha TaxID=74940 RepID=A0A8C8MHC2_ONCTS